MPITQNTVLPEGIDPEMWAAAKKESMQSSATTAPLPEGIDPEMWAAAKKESAQESQIFADISPEINLHPRRSATLDNIEAFSNGVNNSFEQLGRGLLKGAYQIGSAVGIDTDNSIKNIELLSQAAAAKQAKFQETNPWSSGIGSAVGQAAVALPVMAATGGLSGLSPLKTIAQGALSEGALGAASDTTGNRVEAGALGAAIGGAGGALGAGIGKVAAKIGNKMAGVLSPAAQAISENAAMTGVKPTVASVSKNPLLVHAFEYTSDLPGSGTQKAAEKIITAAQSNVSRQLASYAEGFHKDFGDDLVGVMKSAASKEGGNNYAAQELLKEISSSNEWTKQIADSGKLTHFFKEKAYNAEKNDLLAKAGLNTPIYVKDLQDTVNNTIQSAVNKTTGAPLSQYTSNAINTLKKLSDDLGALGGAGGKISAEQLDQQQSIISGILGKMFKQNQVYGDADAALVQGLKKDFDSVLESTLDKDAPGLAAQLRELKGGKFKQLQEMKQPLFAKLITNSTTPDEAAEMAFNAALNGKNSAKILFDNLDDVGRNAVKYGFAKKLYSGITNAAENEPDNVTRQITELTSPKMRKMLEKHGDFIHTFFTPAEFQQINGTLKVAHALDNYATTFSKTPTGRINSFGGKAYAAHAALSSEPTVGVPVAGGVLLFNKIMNSEAGPWLQAASTIQPGSPAWSKIVDKVARIAGISSAGGHYQIPPEEQNNEVTSSI